ncbi:hypothetical protein SLEP1_g30398 [Rubroshorea leprosula]|uniref:NB-ARC domain-containing protein n=1 Tax=Rubroshorea leprosula TaxID=152421 RepID=A0AAV5K8D0_9ROSI|nr:hypothetical protein SLEP1_g30398 [Rubroshorea leprosula]
MAGSGKTMLVKATYNSFAIKQHFECRAFVSVSEQFEERKLLADLSIQLGMVRRDERLSKVELQKRLGLFLAWKRYLIVLDDVYTADVWEELKHAFPNSSNGSRVILTTRDACVPRNIKAHARVIQLRFLNDDESWELFVDKELNVSVWSELIEQSYTKPEEKDGKGEIEEISPSEAGSSDEALSGILALGYQDLDSHLKFCLNYLGLFPKSYKVPFRRLFQLLQAEGLLKQETKEEQVKKYIEDLKKRNMIEVEKQKLNGSSKTICMQSTIYDALIPRAKRVGLFYIGIKHYQRTSKQPIRRFAEHQEINDEKLLEHCSYKLRSYISFKTGGGDPPPFGVAKLLPDNVKRGFGLLVILDLEGVYKPLLSKHLDKFPNLKYLGLRWTFLDSIPDSVGDLPSLETFDVKHTNISTLPGEFWKAKYLKHLYMNNICVDTSTLKASQTNGSLANLQILSGLVIRNKNSVDYLKEVNGLRKLGVTCYGESIGEMVGWISMLTQLQSLKLRSIDSSLNLENLGDHGEPSQLYLFGKLPKEFDFGKFTPNLEILTLAMSELSDDPMEKLGQLKSLKILRLYARSYTGRILTCHSDTFLELQVLNLWKLEKLEEWKVEKGAMPALEEVEIRCCKNLSKTDGLKELTTLKELLVTSMEQNFVKELESLGSNVLIVKENDWKFSSWHSIYKWKSSSWSDLWVSVGISIIIMTLRCCQSRDLAISDARKLGSADRLYDKEYIIQFSNPLHFPIQKIMEKESQSSKSMRKRTKGIREEIERQKTIGH